MASLHESLVTRAAINGAMYALCCDADFCVFVEQDRLLYGDDLLNRAIANCQEDILLGWPRPDKV
jgi:hypothetical protein